MVFLWSRKSYVLIFTFFLLSAVNPCIFCINLRISPEIANSRYLVSGFCNYYIKINYYIILSFLTEPFRTNIFLINFCNLSSYNLLSFSYYDISINVWFINKPSLLEILSLVLLPFSLIYDTVFLTVSFSTTLLRFL